MFGKALEIMLITALKNHIYQFGNKVRLQNKGGPIGLKLTGEIAECIMKQWDKKLIKELRKVNMEPIIDCRFKDDINLVAEAVEKGTKWLDGKLTIDETKRLEDKDKSDSKVTIEVIKEIANNVDPMIRLTSQTPCNFEGGMLPILDVKVKINKNEGNRLDFEFFEKPTKHPKVILMDSALSFSQKRTILTQECLRILRNTKIELGPEVQKKYLDKFMLKLKMSGYDQKFRMEILDSALKAFEKMKTDDEMGIKPMYRSRDWNFEERTRNKSMKKLGWWNSKHSKIKYTSVLFVTPTPGGILVKDLKQREEEINKNSDERVKIVEKGGMKIKDMLETKNPFKNKGSKCVQPTCPLCTSSQFVEGNPEDNQLP